MRADDAMKVEGNHRDSDGGVNVIDFKTNSAVDRDTYTPSASHHDRNTPDDRVALGILLERLGSKSTSLVCLFLVSPFLQPVPLLGLSTPVGIVIALHGLAIAIDKKPWLPKRFASLTMPKSTVAKIASNTSGLFRRIEFLISPRLSVFAVQNPFRFINGVLLILAGLFLALPLPIPFSNGLPALLIFLVSLAHAEEDGVLALVAYAYFAGLMVSGTFLTEAVVHWMKTW